MAFYPAVILPASATPAATGNTSPAAGSEAPSVRARSQGDEDTIALGVVAATLIGGTAWYTLRDNAKKPDAVNSNGAAKTSAKTATLDASAEPIETNDPTSPTSITSKTKQETEPTSENVTTYRQGLIAKGVPLCHAKSPTHFYHEEQVGLLCSKHSLNAALDALSYPLITPESYLSKLDHAREQVKLHDPTSVGTSEVSTTHELIKVIMAHMNENHNNVLSQECWHWQLRLMVWDTG
jgi:hypothetical protein